MIRLSRFMFICDTEDEVDDCIEMLANKFADYEGDAIDDWREYTDGDDKLIMIMTPVGELLFFEVRKYDNDYSVEFLASSWDSKSSKISKVSKNLK